MLGWPWWSVCPSCCWLDRILATRDCTSCNRHHGDWLEVSDVHLSLHRLSGRTLAEILEIDSTIFRSGCGAIPEAMKRCLRLSSSCCCCCCFSIDRCPSNVNNNGNTTSCALSHHDSDCPGDVVRGFCHRGFDLAAYGKHNQLVWAWLTYDFSSHWSWQLASEMSNMTKCIHAQQDWSKELKALWKYVCIFLKIKRRFNCIPHWLKCIGSLDVWPLQFWVLLRWCFPTASICVVK